MTLSKTEHENVHTRLIKPSFSKKKANKVILNDKKRFWSQSQSFIRKKRIRNDMFFFGIMDKSENLSYRKTVKRF
ncbi:MAG: hypothetical protein Ta2E_10810 [Mycoplasmoidaceae bacterium]|nr:MAG: hypothetical protein Ta2E_10810 [Mycoplasmoidaceae bacterium]